MAVKQAERVLERERQGASVDPLQLSEVLLAQAQALVHLRRFAQAGEQADRAVEIRRKVAEEHRAEPRVARKIQALLAQGESLRGEIHDAQGHLSEAERCFRRSVALLRDFKTTGKEERLRVRLLSRAQRGLSGTYESRGDFAAAKTLLQNTLALVEGVGLTQEQMLVTLDLGYLAIETRDYEAAQQLYAKGLSQARGKFPPGHRLLSKIEMNLAVVYIHQGLPRKATSVLESVLAREQKRSGSSHPDLAAILLDLAVAEQHHRPAKALEHARRSHKIALDHYGWERRITTSSANALATFLTRSGDFQESERLYSRLIPALRENSGSAHPSLSLALQNRAYNWIELGRQEEALEAAREADKVCLRVAGNVFSYASESERMGFRKSLHPFATFLTLGSAEDAFLAALHYKGVVLDSLLEDHRLALAAESPEFDRLVRELQDVRTQLSHCSRGEDGRESLWISLESRKREIEESLAIKCGELGRFRSAFSVSIDQVQARLKPGVVLIELLKCREFLGNDRWEQRYFGLVLNSDGSPALVRLGSAKEIEKLVSAHRRAIHRGRGTKAARRLYDQVWGPLERALPRGTNSVVLSPDGDLSLLSFATILSPQERFLAEDYQLSYVTSGRDLLWEAPGVRPQGVALIGAPDFDALLPTAQQSSNSESSWSRLHFARLPYTRQECEQIEAILGAHAPVASYYGQSASEANLRKLGKSGVIHIATHGFFVSRKNVRPMARAGLALAGANSADPSQLDPSNDGVLTAEEASALELTGTRLVTLSACETGLGESVAGFGVSGLRRGFMLAGAQSLVTSLWPVDDRETAELMMDFYRYADEMTPREAMSRVQAEWFGRIRRERGPELALRIAGAFVVHFQGRP